MSEFKVEVVRICETDKHPHADTLSTTKVLGGYPVVFKTGAFKYGDKAVYVPVDALAPLDHEDFAFLRDPNAPHKTHKRIRALKLRGIFSMGMLIPARGDFQEGEDVREHYGIGKYEPPVPGEDSEQEADPGHIPRFTDIEGLRRHPDVLQVGEEVVLTEKIHGANARYAWGRGKMWCGSNRTFLKPGNSIWWQACRQYGLEDKMKLHSNLLLFGEVYGRVQDLHYGVDSGVRFAAFDIFDLEDGCYFPYDPFVQVCLSLDIPMVPELYRGPWRRDLMDKANGKSTLAPQQVREGFVVRPVKERYDDTVGRVIFKQVGEDYLLRKEK